MGLLEKARELKDEQNAEDEGIFEDSFGDLPDLPDLSHVTLPDGGAVFSPSSSKREETFKTSFDISSLGGDDLSGDILADEAELYPEPEISETVESASVETELSSDDLVPLDDENLFTEDAVTDEISLDFDNDVSSVSESEPQQETAPEIMAVTDDTLSMPLSETAEDEPVSLLDEKDDFLSIDDLDLETDLKMPETDASDQTAGKSSNNVATAPADGEKKKPAFFLAEDSDEIIIPDDDEEEAVAPLKEPKLEDISDYSEDFPLAGNDYEVTEPQIIPVEEQCSVLWDASREIVKCSSPADFFNVLILLVMGHIEASSASVIIPLKGEEQSKWILRESRGTRLSAKTITFRSSDSIMSGILSSEGIFDIERYSSELDSRVEYNLFLSINTRYAVALRCEDRVNAVLILGEKLSGGEYSAEDLSLSAALCSFASIVYDRIIMAERLSEENKTLLRKGSELAANESLEKLFLSSEDDSITADQIQERMRSYGIDSYAFFTRTEEGEGFYPVFLENEDLITLRSSSFVIPAGNELCEYLLKADEWHEFENPGSSELLKKLFGAQIILKMNIFIISPFVVKGHLSGFFIVFRARRDILAESSIHALSFSRMVSHVVQSCESVYIDDAHFVDSQSRVLRRLERSIDYAGSLKIPVSAVVFSIKNIKRYCALYGISEGEDLVFRFRSVIESRLSSSEYAVRTDRGKILVMLPGKTKKYAVPFANAVRNELASSYKERESQIMLTFMTGEYPLDGKNIHELLDYLD